MEYESELYNGIVQLIKSKSYLQWGLNLGPSDAGVSCVTLSYLPDLASVCRTETFRSLSSHVLMISFESQLVRKQK